MVSIGPNSQSLNFTHMFDMVDLRGNFPLQTLCKNSLMGIIVNKPEFSKFKYIVNLCKFNKILNEEQADLTIFIPNNDAIPDNILLNMDISTAYHIIKSSMLNHKITSELLENSPSSYFITKDPLNKLFITNISGKTIINNNINIIEKDIIANNGIIHVIDKLIQPIII